jgi:hypothetical protein
VLVAVLALFAALLGAGGVFLLLGDDEPGTTAQDEGTADDVIEGQGRGDATTGPEAETGEATTPADDPTEPAPTEAVAGFTCWDGTKVAKPSRCRVPTGQDGLAWVFPTSDDPGCTPRTGAARVTEADCYPDVAGRSVWFHYSEWRSPAAMTDYYQGQALATLGPPNGRTDLTAYLVESRQSDIGHKVAIMYVDPTAVWSVTIYAADEQQYAGALARLDMRPFRQLRGKRS